MGGGLMTTRTNNRRIGTTTLQLDQICGTCRWYHPTPMHANECRRYAPVVMTTSILPETVWPETEDADWCREWEAKGGIR
jgi:hypothetical protein